MQKMISLELKTKNAWDNAPSVNTQMLSLTKENSHRKKSKALTQILPMYKMYLSLANYFEPYDLSQQQYFKHLRTQGSSKEKLTERYHDSLQKLSEEQQARENEFVEKITDYYVNNSYESEVREFIRITKKTKLKSFLQRSVVEFDRFTRSHAKANFTRILKSITKNQTASI